MRHQSDALRRKVRDKGGQGGGMLLELNWDQWNVERRWGQLTTEAVLTLKESLHMQQMKMDYTLI